MSIKTTILYTFCLFIQVPAIAQDFESLWATGSAVPEGTVQLTKRPDGQFRFAGALNDGELKIMTTEVYQKGTTQFLKPQLVDSYLINKGLNYVLTSDESQPGWVVSFQENTYRFLNQLLDVVGYLHQHQVNRFRYLDPLKIAMPRPLHE